MKLVILAAGRGERMGDLTKNIPKPLLRYGGKTILDRLFLALPDEIDEVIIVIKYLGEKIKEHCGSNFYGRKIRYVEGSLDGNAVGFMKTKEFFNNKERFAVSYGDEIITKKEITDCLKHEFSWLLYEMDNPKDVGIAETNPDGFITNVEEKPEVPKTNLVTNGFMVVNYDIFAHKPELHRKKEYVFVDLMKKFLNHNVFGVTGSKNHLQLTTPEDLKKLSK